MCNAESCKQGPSCFEKPMVDLFGMQDEIVSRLAHALDPTRSGRGTTRRVGATIAQPAHAFARWRESWPRTDGARLVRPPAPGRSRCCPDAKPPDQQAGRDFRLERRRE